MYFPPINLWSLPKQKRDYEFCKAKAKAEKTQSPSKKLGLINSAIQLKKLLCQRSK